MRKLKTWYYIFYNYCIMDKYKILELLKSHYQTFQMKYPEKYKQEMLYNSIEEIISIEETTCLHTGPSIGDFYYKPYWNIKLKISTIEGVFCFCIPKRV